MAKDKLTDYDSTASGNLDVGGISVAEGMLPSGVNNAIRELMSHQADAFGAGTPLYVDQTNNRLGIGNVAPATALDVDANGATVATFDRATSDGSIVDFQKSGSTVGSIGTAGGTITIDGGGTSSGIYFGENQLVPRDNGAGSNNVVDLGQSGNSFKDLYLSGGVYLGGTGSANYLDDYEEGTWTPTVGIGTTDTNSFTGGSYTTQNGRYTKVGNMVTLWFHIRISNKGSQSGTVFMKGLPFTNNNDDSSSEGSTVNINYWSSMGNPVYLTGYVQNALAQIVLTDGDATTSTPVITNSDLTNSSNWYGAVTYRVD